MPVLFSAQQPNVQLPHLLLCAAVCIVGSQTHTYVYMQVLTLMARAYHDAGDHMAARRCLTKGLHQFPTDMKLRFNLGFVLQVSV